MSRSFVWSLIVLAVLFLLTAVFYVIPPLNDITNNTFYLAGTIVYQIALLVPVLLLLYGYSGIEAKWKGRWGWLMVLLAMTAYFVGDTIWNIYETTTMLSMPHPGLADIFYVIFYPLIVLAMTRFIRVADVKISPSEKLLIGIVAVLLAAEAIGRFVVPSLAGFISEDYSLFARILDSFYLLSDVVILCIGLIIVVQFWGGKVTTTYILFVIGIFVMTITDAAYVFVSESFGLRNPLDLGWAAAYSLLALAAVFERSLQEAARRGLANA